MNLKFKHLHLVGFGSYADAELDLENLGFCLISGENLFKRDNASSNGSGKSTIFSAICYALTGETLSGVKSNLKNIYLENNECAVTLDFEVDADQYQITRIHKPKSDLKLIQNNIDVSGKGITETSQKLEKLLPNLTKELIASTVLLGQGNINKFSTLSPSGRKQLLETLTQSDYQIEDIKNRIASRIASLSQQSLAHSNTLVACQALMSNLKTQKSNLEIELQQAVKPDFKKQLEETAAKIQEYQDLTVKLTADLALFEATEEQAAAAKLRVTADKSSAILKLNTDHTNSVSDLKISLTNVTNNIKNLTNDILQAQSIKDTCPTCGQKLLGVIKPDTTLKEQQLKEQQGQAKMIQESLNQKHLELQTNTTEIENSFAQSLTQAEQELTTKKSQVTRCRQAIIDSNNCLAQYRSRQTQLEQAQATWDSHYSSLQDKLNNCNEQILNCTAKQQTAEVLLAETQAHLDVVKKIDTLTKRDLRSYLLTDIINYIDTRAKDFCEIVFGTRELDIKIEGNNLNIAYGNKAFDNLSGGEKQRCDLILQFAIRELLQNYLGYTSNIIVLDEVFDALDAVATERILALISTQLQDIESVFIISHHAAEIGLTYDFEIKVLKQENGISEILKN